MASIIVADDSMFQRFLLSKAVQSLGHTVIEAKNGNECLELARQNKAELLLLDLNMPGMSGLEVLQAIHDETIPLKTIVITADIQNTTRQRCAELGVTDFLNKPVDENQVTGKLTELLG